MGSPTPSGVAHQLFQGVRRFRLTPFLCLVAYRLRIFDHRGKPEKLSDKEPFPLKK